MSHLLYPLPDRLESEGRLVERALARAMARWVASHGGGSTLAALAARAAVAEQQGDTALAALDRDAREALASEPMVGDGRLRTPFVLDAAGRFYLWRNHLHEGEVAAALRERHAAATPLPVDEALVSELFAGGDPALDGAQREAVRAIGGRRLLVLTGGPGTGKTTTVLRMLLRLLHDGIAAREGIAVAAPTGKAAQRLLQSLRQEAHQLRERLPAHWGPCFDALPLDEARTVHRLLGWSPARQAYARGPENPIEAGVVVVDEASMLDLAQLRALLRALRPGACLLLVGDADQLDSVGAGSVLMDLVDALDAGGSPARVRLVHSFRAVRPLVRLNEAVRSGEPVQVAAALAQAGESARLHPVEQAGALARRLRDWADSLAGAAPPAALAGEGAASAAAALRALPARQLLCALREGPFGADEAGARIEARLRQAWRVPEGQTWFPGRVVMITRNDYGARLFNGDVGLCLADAEGRLQVWFEGVDGSARAFAPAALPAHSPAWAITIHKSQGSEYGHVAVLLPPDPEHRILSRQLLYTGLSRAKHSVEVWGPQASLEAALAAAVRRSGGLRDRLGVLR